MRGNNLFLEIVIIINKPLFYVTDIWLKLQLIQTTTLIRIFLTVLLCLYFYLFIPLCFLIHFIFPQSGPDKNSRSRISSTSDIRNENGEIDYKKLYEQQLIENERLKEKLKKSEEELRDTKLTLEKINVVVSNDYDIGTCLLGSV